MRTSGVLIVDDSATGRAYVNKTLILSGVAPSRITQCENGKIASEYLSSQAAVLIFLDLNMPVMGGLELVEWMQQQGKLKGTTVVITSSDGNEKKIERLKSLGVSLYLRKPFAPEALIPILKDFSGENV